MHSCAQSNLSEVKKYFFSSAKFDMWCPKKNHANQTHSSKLQYCLIVLAMIIFFSTTMFKSSYFLHSIKYSETYFFIEFGHKRIKFSTFYSNNFEQCANCIFFLLAAFWFFCSFISATQLNLWFCVYLFFSLLFSF